MKKDNRENRTVAKKTKYCDLGFFNDPIDYDSLNSKERVDYQKTKGKNVKCNFYKNAIKSKHANKGSKRRDKQLAGDAINLTDLQVSSLLTKIFTTRTAASFRLALSLFVGRKNIKSIEFNWKDTFSFTFPVHKKDYGLNAKVSKLFNKTQSTLTLPLPGLFDYFDGIDINKSSDEDVDDLLKEINSSAKHSRILKTRVEGYLEFWMTNQGYDTTEIANILGKIKDPLSGVKYYQVEAFKLQKIYETFVVHLLKIIGKSYEPIQSLQQGLIGSELPIKKEYLSMILQELHKEITDSRIANVKELHHYHNLITIYTLIILNLSTGHRPVNNPYQYINNINLFLNTVFIEDKRRESLLVNRVTVLTKIGNYQVKSYISYIKYFTKKFNLLLDDAANSFIQILNGELPFFQLFQNGELIPIKKKHLELAMKEILPIPLNWNRHFMRTELRRHGISGQDVDMWMGHEGVGGYGLDNNSNCSMNNLQKVADEIDNILKDLGIRHIEAKWQ